MNTAAICMRHKCKQNVDHSFNISTELRRNVTLFLRVKWSGGLTLVYIQTKHYTL